MEATEFLASFALVLLLSGCASFQVGSQFQAGRQALLRNNPEQALAYFQRAAQMNPDYVFQAESFREGIWTYLGRAQYATGKLPDARRSFEQALSKNKDDYMARLFLGLTLARNGDRSAALKEIQSGLKELYDWLEYKNATQPFDALWDPSREIRSEIEKDLAMISAKDTIGRNSFLALNGWEKGWKRRSITFAATSSKSTKIETFVHRVWAWNHDCGRRRTNCASVKRSGLW